MYYHMCRLSTEISITDYEKMMRIPPLDHVIYIPHMAKQFNISLD